MTLLERIESASAEEQRGLLEEAAIKLMGGSQASIDPRWQRWDKLLDAKAYVDAALMLKPEGWGWNLHAPSRPDPDNPPSARIWGYELGTFQGTARVPALAIAAASLRAGGGV